jgi:hypothetical protein
MTAQTFQLTVEGNEQETIDHTKMLVASITRQEWDTNARRWTMVAPMLVHRTWST